MSKPIGALTKLGMVPVGRMKKTSFSAVVDEKVSAAITALPIPEKVVEIHNTETIKEVNTSPELNLEEVAENINKNQVFVDGVTSSVLRKLPPTGGNTFTIKDLPGYKTAQSGYVFGVLGKKAGFWDPDALGIGVVGTPSAENYTRLIDTDGAYKYVGEANIGELESAASWRIKRIEFLVGDDIEILWAYGNANFNNVWDDRLTLTYS